MSPVVISQTRYSGVPRLSEAKWKVLDFLVDDVINKNYYCPQNHEFTLTFINNFNIPSYWECPTCETLAPEHK